MALEYGFNERLRMSSGVAAAATVRDVLLMQVPGALNIVPAASANDRLGVDWWVEMRGARHLAVDAKIRERDWAADNPHEDDLALETWSVVENGVPGWTRDPDKRCDYILWIWRDTGRFCLIPFPMLCAVFSTHWQRWRGLYKTRQQFTPRPGGGYHSECVFVPRREVWAEIYRQFGGSLEVSYDE